MNDEEIQWITVNGNHIPIKPGQTKEQAIKERFNFDAGEESFDNYNSKELSVMEYASEYRKNVKDVYIQSGVFYTDRDGNRINATKLFKDSLEKTMNNREVYREDIENAVVKILPRTSIILKDYGGTSYKGYPTNRMQMNFHRNNDYQNIKDYFHEMGHALDDNQKGGYYSSSYNSKKYGVTLSEMINEEFNLIDDSTITELRDNIIYRLNDLNDRHANNELNQREYLNKWYRTNQVLLDIADTIQSCKGYSEAKRLMSTGGHKSDYFEGVFAEENRGTELFAELTSSLVSDEDKEFASFIKKHCPRTYEIYEEILKEFHK